ncbi:MAG: hypothetical protein ACR2G6_06030 [Gemmatimonadaceae bacterium]
MRRPNLSPGALYTRLQAEYKRRRTVGCDRCRVPLPYLIERPDEVSANWRIGTLQPCVHKCDVIIAEIAAGLWPQYDLNDPISVPVREPASQQGSGSELAPATSDLGKGASDPSEQ